MGRGDKRIHGRYSCAVQIGFVSNRLLPVTALAYPVQVAKNGVLEPKGQFHITDMLSRRKKIKMGAEQGCQGD